MQLWQVKACLVKSKTCNRVEKVGGGLKQTPPWTPFFFFYFLMCFFLFIFIWLKYESEGIVEATLSHHGPRVHQKWKALQREFRDSIFMQESTYNINITGTTGTKKNQVIGLSKKKEIFALFV